MKATGLDSQRSHFKENKYGDTRNASIETASSPKTKGERLDETPGNGDPERGIFQIRTGKLWPGLSQDPACYGFTIIAKLKPGREAAMRSYADTVEKALQGDPSFLAP